MTKIEPVACYAGHRSTPEGTKEFYGYADKPLEPATMFYTEAQMRQLGEACAALLENQKYMVLNPLRTFTPDEVCRGKKETALYSAARIRNLIKEMLP